MPATSTHVMCVQHTLISRTLFMTLNTDVTSGNLEFALCVEQDNQALHERAEKIRALRSHGDPTVPTTIGLERATNPFMRCHLPEVKAAIGMVGCSDVEAFAEIRARKDMF